MHRVHAFFKSFCSCWFWKISVCVFQDSMIIIASDANLEEEVCKIGKPGILSGGTFVDLSRRELRQQAKQNL